MDGSLSGGNVQPEVRKGPWTMEEDLILMSYIAVNGEGAWNNLARAAGLNRTGKSCRLRWLNYLRPGVRRGNFTPEEQMLIVELQSRWGNRWSKIAKHLPGRTDNEIKNFWRTKIQKKRKQCCGENENTAVGYSNAAMFATDDQAGRNTSHASSTQGGHGIVAQTSLLCLDQQNNAVQGGGGGMSIPDIPPELLAEPSDNFSWTFEDFWSPMHSLNCSF